MICATRRRIYGRDPHELSDRICKKEAASALVAADPGGGAAVAGNLV